MKHRNNNTSSNSIANGSISSNGNRKNFSKVNVPKPVNLPISTTSNQIVNANSVTSSSIASSTAGSLPNGNTTPPTTNVSNANPTNPNTSTSQSNAWISRLQFTSQTTYSNESNDSNNNLQSGNDTKSSNPAGSLSLPVRSTRQPLLSSPVRDDSDNIDDNESNNNSIQTTPKSCPTPSETSSDKKLGDSHWSEISDDDEIYDKELEELIEKETKTSTTPQVKTKKQKYLEKKKLLREERLNAEKQAVTSVSTPKSDSENTKIISSPPSTNSSNNNSPPPSPPLRPSMECASPPSLLLPKSSNNITNTDNIENLPITEHSIPSFFSTLKPSNVSDTKMSTQPTQPKQTSPEPVDIVLSIKEQEAKMNEAAERRRREKQEEEERIERERLEKSHAKLMELEKKLAEKAKPVVTELVEQPKQVQKTDTQLPLQHGEVKILKSNRINQPPRHRPQRNNDNVQAPTPVDKGIKEEPNNPIDVDNNWRDSSVKVQNPFVESFQKKKYNETEDQQQQQPKEKTFEHQRSGDHQRGGKTGRGRGAYQNTRGGGSGHHNPRQNNFKNKNDSGNDEKTSDTSEMTELAQPPAIDFSNVLKNINPNETKISFGLFAEDTNLVTHFSHNNEVTTNTQHHEETRKDNKPPYHAKERNTPSYSPHHRIDNFSQSHTTHHHPPKTHRHPPNHNIENREQRADRMDNNRESREYRYNRRTHDEKPQFKKNHEVTTALDVQPSTNVDNNAPTNNAEVTPVGSPFEHSLDTKTGSRPYNKRNNSQHHQNNTTHHHPPRSNSIHENKHVNRPRESHHSRGGYNSRRVCFVNVDNDSSSTSATTSTSDLN